MTELTLEKPGERSALEAIAVIVIADPLLVGVGIVLVAWHMPVLTLAGASGLAAVLAYHWRLRRQELCFDAIGARPNEF
jgi:hypothetical protein